MEPKTLVVDVVLEEVEGTLEGCVQEEEEVLTNYHDRDKTYCKAVFDWL